MRCGDCGHNMHFHVNSKNPDIHFFACSNSKVDKRGTCTPKRHCVRADAIEQIVKMELQRLITFLKADEDTFIDLLTEKTNNDMFREKKVFETEIQRCISRREKLTERYRKHVKELSGTPDIVLSKYRTVIFVNGCFWHMHEGCKYFVWPKNNAEFWRDKILANRERDKKVVDSLEQAGWRVITIWECELKGPRAQATLESIVQKVKANCRTPKTQFGDLTGFIIADKNVPADGIKNDCRGIFEKRRSRKANKIKGFAIGQNQRQG